MYDVSNTEVQKPACMIVHACADMSTSFLLHCTCDVIMHSNWCTCRVMQVPAIWMLCIHRKIPCRSSSSFTQLLLVASYGFAVITSWYVRCCSYEHKCKGYVMLSKCVMWKLQECYCFMYNFSSFLCGCGCGGDVTFPTMIVKLLAMN